jgi:hypothetical protein
MNWMRERPTVPGWYWTIETWDDEPLLFEVDETEDGLRCGERHLGHHAWDRTQWCGPIDIPRPPKPPSRRQA